MTSFSVLVGPCEICSKAGSSSVGSRTCESCGVTFSPLCRECASGKCPKCKGKLEETNKVFPHSLFQAIRKGEDFIIRNILDERHVNLDEIRHTTGGTPLSYAACSQIIQSYTEKHVTADICKLLIERGASPRGRGEGGRTALMIMVHNRSSKFSRNVAELLDSSVNDQDNYGCTALMFAAEGAGGFGARKGNLTIIQMLLDFGADALLQDNRGRTALGYAIASNDKNTNQDVISFLRNVILNQTARREFKARNTYDFDNNGNLIFTARNEQ